MTKYERGLQLIEEKVGNGKDNVISLATIAREPSPEGNPRPFSREVDAFYEDGTFYITTWGKSNKMMQIEKNPEVSFSVFDQWFSGNGKGENLGWVMKPENAEIRLKLRTAFSAWYEFANNESDENCCILAIHITRATINHNHGAEFFHMDFVNKTEGEEGRIL
ncbi:MAG: pyridoxamine 5'-phosphate oxidase family protein [Lachnospiraceae bacterium]|nr:pyridoxamine 5'-phosphate oxidase family protein [Lachnospiraceae bacterium]